ncbi:MAG TPA: hypothetical protein VGX22_05480 [Candidatus Dormibacteraeota bacterium]|nr:hypothetical protein [Candidatus Dormibacteraeota bacterium]
MNNLRRDIHSAFEVIEPPLGGMPERVVQTVLAERNGRLRKEKMVHRLRLPLSLVAVFLVIVVATALLVNERLILKRSSNEPAPAGQSSVTLAQLESRPIDLPTIGPNDPCPQNMGTNSRGYTLGSGPVYADGGNATTTNWGTYFDVTYFTAPDLTGLVLIRGRDLRDANIHVVFVGKYGAGPVVGNDPDPQGGAQHDELLLDASHPSQHLNADGMWAVRQGLAKSASNCYGFRVDGRGFTETFTGGT